MIYLITGTPGAGKSLYALHSILNEKEFQDRPLWIHGMDTDVEHRKLQDVYKWFECGDGSVIFIDEAWQHFPPRKPGQAIPEHIGQFATHRHRGFDVVLVCQHPGQLDSHIRRVVGRHYHLTRPGNSETATIKKYDQVNDYNSKRQPYEKKRWNFDKTLYDRYQSASLNTHRKKLPKRFYFAVGFLTLGAVLFPVLGWTLWGTISQFFGNNEKFDQASGEDLVTPAARAAFEGNSSSDPRGDSGTDWEDLLKPRVEGIPWSAPIYDRGASSRATPPTIFCAKVHAESGGPIPLLLDCICHTDQGVRIEVSASNCQTWARDGLHQPWKQPAGAGLSVNQPRGGQEN